MARITISTLDKLKSLVKKASECKKHGKLLSDNLYIVIKVSCKKCARKEWNKQHQDNIDKRRKQQRKYSKTEYRKAYLREYQRKRYQEAKKLKGKMT